MESEEDEVRMLLSHHRAQIVRELQDTQIVPVLLKNSVISASDEVIVNDECDLEKKCSHLIDYVSKNGFEKFKEFCYAIESECPKLIEDLIQDRLKYDTNNSTRETTTTTTTPTSTSTTTSDTQQTIEVKQDESIIPTRSTNLSRRSTSCCDSKFRAPIASPRFEAQPKHLPKSSPTINRRTSNSDEDNHDNVVEEMPPIYANNIIDAHNINPNPKSNYASLFCHQSLTSSPAVKKRNKLAYSFSSVGTWDAARRSKKNRRHYHSMNETIEVLADPVIEDDIFGDRTSWEYHTVSVTRVPGYGFGIAVSGGRDNPHFANGDPSIAVSDVLKGGPAEDRLQVNDRIISVNGVSLENVEYATAVQVLRDSGNTVTLMVKRRVSTTMNSLASPSHQHTHSLASSTGFGQNSQTIKLVLTKSSKKEDFGLVLGCRLFIKEISSKARDQLALNGYSLQEGDIVTRLHNTNTNDSMSLKEAKKIIDGCKERLNFAVIRDGPKAANNATTAAGFLPQSPAFSAHAAQASNCSNLDDTFFAGGSNYSAQNLYVQPPTRPAAMSTLLDDKSNLTPRGRSRNPLMDVSLLQLDRPTTPPGNGIHRSGSVDDPPRPPPPRVEENFYSSRRQLYEDDPLRRSKQSAEPRFISFQKEGSVGIRLTGGNEAGIFVTAVQPGSPASLQGLTPGDKILKVNDMAMHGVTREEAVLFLLSLQDRIDLIVQHCKEEYDQVVANQRGDSFHIKTHFHCENPSKGEMSFKAGDIFRVVDTLHNGVVGSWQVLRIGRGQQEIQRGVIPNKSRAEELATAQFNATKKEMNSSESRTSFFRRRRPTHRRSKSLSRDNWDDVVFSDSVSKFPAYERVVLRHPGFVRPVVIFGPVSDLARERLTKDFPDKFTVPLQQDAEKSNATKSAIVRLSNIRDIMDRGKHALLDITPNAVDRLNYAQFYPIVVFLKADTKHMIKQLRQGVPKTAHKSSKKLLEQCQKLDRMWSHIFSSSLVFNDAETWYRKLRESIDQLQSGAVWMSESKPVESLSDDFLFPMTTSRLSYASSPESDLELSPGPSASLSLGNLPHLVKSNSDPSIATHQDNLDRDRELGELMPPPYTNNDLTGGASHVQQRSMVENKYGFSNDNEAAAVASRLSAINGQLFYSSVPELPPRIDRASKPPGVFPTSPGGPLPALSSASRNNSSGTLGRSAQERLFGVKAANESLEFADASAEYSTRANLMNPGANSLERQQQNSLDRSVRPNKTTGSYDSMSSYDSCNTTQISMQRLGPNAPDDLKSVPPASRVMDPSTGNSLTKRNSVHEHVVNGKNRQNSPGRPAYMADAPLSRGPGASLSYNWSIHGNNSSLIAMNIPQRPGTLGVEMSPLKKQPPPVETKTDYGKYSRNNSASQADYVKSPKSPQMGGGGGGGGGGGVPFKPVPPPKPKNYRPPIQGGGQPPNSWENGGGEPTSPRSPNGFFYPPTPAHYHQTPPSMGKGQPVPPPGMVVGSATSGGHHANPMYNYNQYAGGGNHYPGNQGNPNAHYAMNGGGYNGTNHVYAGGQQYMQRNPVMGNGPPPSHISERHALDLAGSREQRGSAFELYRKPQIGNVDHHHNMSGMEQQYAVSMYANEMNERQQYYSHGTPPPLPPPKLKKKSISILKSPLVALKKVFSKSKPLRRQNSLVESEPRPRPSLRRQHSMLEPQRQPIHHMLMNTPELSQRQKHEYNHNIQRYFSRHEAFHPSAEDAANSTYQNLESEAIYGNTGNTSYYDQESMYANRAYIEFERRSAAMSRQDARVPAPPLPMAAHSKGLVRRHSMADRPPLNYRLQPPRGGAMSPQHLNNCHENTTITSTAITDEPVDREDIYMTRSGAFMMENSYNRREEEAIYQSRREMHRDHLYQSKAEMQQRLHQSRIEAQRAHSESPMYASRREILSPVTPAPETPGKDQVLYQSRQELKERGFRTRTQLRDHIYQSRREAMQSMAEPVYVSKREMKHDPIYESRESCVNRDISSREVSPMTPSTSGGGGGGGGGGLAQESDEPKNDLNSKGSTDGVDDTVELILNLNINDDSNTTTDRQSKINDVDDDDETTLTNANQSDLQKSKAATTSPDTSNDAQPPRTDMALSPRANRAPYHISNMIKRTAPPAAEQNDGTPASMAAAHASHTSIETQYTQSSFASSLMGPPNAHSTPYTSEMALVGMRSAQSAMPPLREQSTTSGVFDENGGTLCDNVWNVSINIPKGAIKAGIQQEIYFTVTDPRLSQAVGGPPLDMENGETMLSPLVMCGPQGLEFLVPVTLNIPHCAGRTASLGLALKATDSEKNLCTNWDNIDLPSNAAAHTVSVKVDHF